MEQTHLCLKPKNPDACIRDPRSRVRLPEAGGRVPNNSYWRARVRDGDCVVTTEAPAKKAKKAPKATGASKNSTSKSATEAKKAAQ